MKIFSCYVLETAKIFYFHLVIISCSFNYHFIIILELHFFFVFLSFFIVFLSFVYNVVLSLHLGLN